MITRADMIRNMNDLARSIPLTRNSIAIAELAVDADLTTVLTKLSGNHKERALVAVVYSNHGATDKTKALDIDFSVEAVFYNSHLAQMFVANERPDRPEVTFRVLDLFERKFQSFYEYPSVDSMVPA